ncbi:acyltransferase [Pararhizobium capsulatum]|uniref:acyltransferase n=1 Tax=Pararhizobium capsulatum TaxID=34014 RepID=UPI0027D807E2|nr:acyltransferase [Pararhizobium capsulatum]
MIEIDKSSSFKGHITVKGKYNRVVVGRNCALVGEIMVKGNNQTVTIGDETTFVSVYLLCLENKDVTIGRSCMFSRDIEIRTSDAHALIDNKKKTRLNLPASVVIGDHVWIGVGAVISKGSVIADDSVVGAKSFVNKAFSESNIVIAGTPAKIIRRGVTWNRQRRSRYTREALDAWRLPPED